MPHSSVHLNKISNRQISIKIPYIKFHVSPSSGSSADTYGQTDGILMPLHSKTAILRWYNIAGNKKRKKRCLGLNIKCPKFLSDNQIWIFSTDLHRSPQDQIWRKSGRRHHACGQTGRLDDGNRPVPGPTKHHYSRVTGDSFFGVKQSRLEPDDSPPSSTKVKKKWS